MANSKTMTDKHERSQSKLGKMEIIQDGQMKNTRKHVK